jgi:membrane protease YdiL (CAAX protease family)
LLFAGCLGLLYGITYEYTDSLLLITVMHGVLNVFLFAVVPIYGPFVL